MSKTGCGHFGHGTLKLVVSQDWIDVINCFFIHSDANSGKLKVTSMISGWVWSKMDVAF